MDVKALKKIAKQCRKLGIKTYKCSEFEFTLSDEVPESTYKKKQKEQAELSNPVANDFNSDSLTDDQLLFFSVPELPEESPIEKIGT